MRFYIGLWGVTLILLLLGLTTPPLVSGQEAATPVSENTTIVDISDDRVNIVIQTSATQLEGESPAVIRLSAVTYASTKRPTTIQLILEAPSGVSISGTSAETGQGNQFSVTETLAPGTSESIRVTARPSETGTYTLNGEIIYFPEGQSEDAQAERISLSISRTAERGLLYWTPTIIAALISGGLTISMLFSTRFRKMNPNAEAYALGVIIHLTIGTLVMYVSLGVLLSPVVDSVGSVVVLAFLYAFFSLGGFIFLPLVGLKNELLLLQICIIIFMIIWTVFRLMLIPVQELLTVAA
jgi:hypothetical protein